MRFVLIVLLLLIFPADAAVIQGKVYSWETLDILKNAVVEINTTPPQRYVAADGSYSFTVTPGIYSIKAYYMKNGKIQLEAEEIVSIDTEGEFVLDLILFPPLPQIETPVEPEFYLVDEGTNYFMYAIPFILALIVVAVVYLYKRRTVQFEGEEAEPLPEELNEVLEEIKKVGGRITQKELRKRLGYSEAKMSLIIADLERRGIIEKVKKGRGNIIFLK
jgi:uncharacterized membrane protein